MRSVCGRDCHCSKVSIQRSNYQKVARTDTHILTNKHLNIPFCDLSISGYSGKTADAALFTNLSARTLRAQQGLTVRLLHIPRPCSVSTVQKRPRRETSWFVMESNRVRTCSA